MGAQSYDRFGLTRTMTVPVGPMVSGLTAKITMSGVRKAVWRLKMAGWIFWLGARVAGMNGKLEIE